MANQEITKINKKSFGKERRFVRASNRVNRELPKPPKRSFFRQILRFFIHPITLSLATLFFGGLALILAYYWSEYSDKIDGLLRGEVFTRSAGVYSAPKLLKDGEKVTPDDLVKYLKSAGYVEKNQQADNARSRYDLANNTLEIEPGETAQIDGKKVYNPLKITFDKSGKSIAEITDLSTNKPVKQTFLEPKILSSITAETGGRRKAVAFQDLPQSLIKAIITTEDRSFFEHHGVNFRGIARALYRRYDAEDNSPINKQGGSSITQQLVKNLLLNNDPTLERKVREAYMSLILETKLSKEEIFTLYANQIYLGQQAGISIYGVGEAANTYFGKDVSALTLPESAFLAGIIRSPNRYNPYKNPEKVTERRNQVLQSMLEAGEISQAQFDEGKATQLTLVPLKNREDLFDMPYFTQYAEEELPKIVSDPQALQHLRVYTTIDPDLQRAAYEAVTSRLEKLDKRFPKKKENLNAALIAIRPKTGEIVAMVGGRDFLQNQFNRATDAQRQPGSVFKPFVYATAINSAYDSGTRSFTTSTIFKDEKKTFLVGTETYSPNNYGDVFSDKEITLRDALVKSKNTITVDLGEQLNMGKVMNLAAKAGMPKVEKAYPSMALGTAEATPLQVATAYTIFANLGEKSSPVAVNRVANGNGQTITEPKTEKTRVLQPDVAYILDDMMKDVINRGTATDAQAWGFRNVVGKAAFAGKTGTSRDGWFAGFTPELVCVVYVGFDNGDDLGMKGSDSALPIWADFMREALNRHPEWNGDWQAPGTIQKAEIDIRDGKTLRELDNAQAEAVQAELKIAKKKTGDANSNTNTNVNPNADAGNPITQDSLGSLSNPDSPESESSVPAEFRRVELFVRGTVPMKSLPEINTAVTFETPLPIPSTTPFTTWENESAGRKNYESKPEDDIPPAPLPERKVTVMICELSGMRATSSCLPKEPKTFPAGKEPKEFCDIHKPPPK